jgi:hypothetical protein
MSLSLEKHKENLMEFLDVYGAYRYVAVIGSFFSIDCNFDPYPSGFIGQV